jgi:CRP/FNR family transcriptional regulator, cyclic AMP receptor protein
MTDGRRHSDAVSGEGAPVRRPATGAVRSAAHAVPGGRRGPGTKRAPQPLRIPAPPLQGALWHELLRRATIVDVPAHSPILDGGGPAPVVAVVGGLARVFLRVGPGREATVGYARARQVIGLAQVLGTDEFGAEAVTATRVAILPLDGMRAILAQHPDVAWRMVEWTAGCLVGAMRSVVDGLHEPVTVRVARHLVDLSMPAPGGGTIAPVTHQYLAAAVGTVREVVTRSLRELRRRGLVATGPGHIVLLDAEGLARVAEGAGSGAPQGEEGSRRPR